MRLRALSAIVVWLLVFPAAAVAGAPNYDCVVDGTARLLIDQWAGIAAARGFEPGPTVWGTTADENQNGPSLDLVATLGGAPWRVSIRGTGTSLVIDNAAGTLHGSCAFVPGNFVLRTADSGGSTLRTGPSPSASHLLAIPFGTAVWQIPDRLPVRHWLPVRAFIARNGRIRTLDGWLRQRKPLVPRYA